MEYLVLSIDFVRPHDVDIAVDDDRDVWICGGSGGAAHDLGQPPAIWTKGAVKYLQLTIKDGNVGIDEVGRTIPIEGEGWTVSWQGQAFVYVPAGLVSIGIPYRIRFLVFPGEV